MKNISNQALFTEDCTKCSNCGKASWYVMECDCGYIFCEHCSAEHVEKDSDNILLVCPKCDKSVLYV